MDNKLLYDAEILNLETLIEMYDDSSVEIVNCALLGFAQAAEIKLMKLETCCLVDDLVEVSRVAHSLSGLCRFSAAVKLGKLSDELNLAAKNNDKLHTTRLISEIHTHWPVLEKQIKHIVKNYRDVDA